jgi:hypothetical protein
LNWWGCAEFAEFTDQAIQTIDKTIKRGRCGIKGALVDLA